MWRMTVLIGPDGRILNIWREVRVPQNAAEVLAAAVEVGQGG
jgi:peroxiredoxin